jgi:epoxyqueuosine reductase
LPAPQRALIESALEAGFDLASAVPLAPPPAAERFRAWLEAGHHAGMAWLERQAERIADPRQLVPGARTLLVVGLGHARPPAKLADGARVARYAAGRDYHNLLTKRLRKLARALRERGETEAFRAIVDAGPLLERSHAAAAGLGFESKAANLLHPRWGPWFFLGELLLETPWEAVQPPPAPGSCGTCRACLDACPTGALLEPGVLSAERCISYQTIEHRGWAPRELRASFGDWAFGCDVCSEVCPFGQRAPDASERFGTHAAVTTGRLVDWLGLPGREREDPGRFAAQFEGSPLRRPGPTGLARNAAVVLGNRPPSPEARAALMQALADPAPELRVSAAWALARGYGSEEAVVRALEAAAAAEPDPAAREDLQRSADLAP